MFHDILVAIDLTDTAHRALVEAGTLAEALNSRLTIIAVAPQIPPFAYRAPVDVEALEKEALAETEDLLRKAVDALPEELPVTKVMKIGNPGEEIVKQIEAGDHDLLVMGSRGRSRVVSNLFGSVAAHVHFHSHIAMLVIHPEA
jgi:nucleotide-binding universal stress UspA family protein